MTVSFDSKQQYFAYVAHKYDTTSDVIEIIAHGEEGIEDETLIDHVLREFVNHPQFMYIALIWKGTPFPGTIFNVRNYEYTGQVMEGLHLFLYKKAYLAQIFAINSTIGDLDYFRRLMTKRPECGVVILAAENVQNLQTVCDEFERPSVFLHYPSDVDITDQYLIAVDAGDIMTEVVSYLYNLGHRDIAYVHGSLSLNIGRDRLHDYYKALESVGLAVDQGLVIGGNWQESGGYAAALKLLSLEKKPTAIIAANDRMAVGAMNAVKASGLCIPDDISIVGYDDIAAATLITPTLSTIHQPMTRIGAKAAEYIVSLLEGDTPEPRHYYLPVEFIIRDSIGAAPQ